MNRRLYQRAWLALMVRLERRLYGKYGRARNRMVRRVAQVYEDNGGYPPAHLFAAYREEIYGILDAHYKAVIPMSGRMATNDLRSRRMGRKAAGSLFDALIAEWIAREALRKSRMIADTDRDEVVEAMGAGVAEGLGTAEIARNIRKVAVLTVARAATIARTETNTAANYGAMESAKQAEEEYGIRLVKEWLPTQDDRTRESHLAMRNHPAIPLGEKFDVGGEPMDRPGDPSAAAENVINCRCTTIVREAD